VEWIVFDDTYSVEVFISGVVGAIAVPSAPFHTTFTVTGTSTAGFNSTVQIRVSAESDKLGLRESE
jgi:hypothetical protein